MNTIRISAVSYLNTLPLIYGIRESGILKDYKLRLDVPSVCAQRLLNDEADISLVPVGALPSFDHYELIGKHCIGAIGNVKTVLLLSNTPVNQLRKIYLDTDSRTSVVLIKVLAKHLWKVAVEWESLAAKDPLKLEQDEGVVLIGDKTFGKTDKFSFCYDLAGSWQELTGLPFVFAAWISTKPLPPEFIEQFEAALEWGVQHKNESIYLAQNLVIPEYELLHYLEFNISFGLDEAKKQGMELFLSYLREEQK